MHHAHRVRSASGLLAGVAAAAVALACGGGGRATTPAARGPDAGAEGGPFATSAPPSGLPPMATMPPPGVAGSKKAKLRPDPALAACSAARPQAKDAAGVVKGLGEACAAPSKMKPAGAMLEGKQGDRDAHEERRFHAEAGRCYRLYFAGGEGVRDMSIVLRDSAGDVVATSAGPALPDDGAVCFTSSDEVTVLVGVGGGKGAWAAQLWSE